MFEQYISYLYWQTGDRLVGQKPETFGKSGKHDKETLCSILVISSVVLMEASCVSISVCDIRDIPS